MFSVRWWPDFGLLTSTSDDRTVTVWQISKLFSEAHETSKKTCDTILALDFPNDLTRISPISRSSLPMKKKLNHQPCRSSLDWELCTISKLQICHGHQSRVWNSLIVSTKSSNQTKKLDSCPHDCVIVIGIGEDSSVCAWRLSDGALVRSWRAHDGASVWCAEMLHQRLVLLTAGAEGALKQWCIRDVFICDLHDCKSKTINDSSMREYRTKNCSSFTEIPSLPWNDINELKSTRSAQENPFSISKGKLFLKNEDPRRIGSTFVRCLCLVGRNSCVLTLDNGEVWLWRLVARDDCEDSNYNSVKTNLINEGRTDCAQWELVMKDDVLRGYSVASATDSSSEDDTHAIAIGGLCGDVFILISDNNGKAFVYFYNSKKCVYFNFLLHYLIPVSIF